MRDVQCGVPDAEALRAQLLASGVAGRIATTREQSLRRCRLFAARDPRALLGLDPAGEWTVPRLRTLIAERCGVPEGATALTGRDRIDPGRTIAALDAFAARLAVAVARRSPVLLGTGHPARLLEFYAELAGALSAAGCRVLTPGAGSSVDITTSFGVRVYELCYVRGVALIRERGARRDADAPGAHSHSPLPVRRALAVLAGAGGPLPELVIGDHGWACGAGQLGIPAIGPADTDDPAMFVGQVEGQVGVAVPVDDAVPSAGYRPLTRYVLNRACLSQ